MKVAVLGAAGLVGRAIVRDLKESAEVTGLVELDRRRSRAAGADIAAVDASDRQQLALALEGLDVLVNAAGYTVNPAAMDAALAAGCHYLDLGGMHRVTERQLLMHPDWEASGRLAVLGCGASPGITNVLAAWAAEQLDEVDRVRCASADHDAEQPPGVSLPYALATLLDQISQPPLVLSDGALVELKPCADGGEVDFPEPIGRRSSLQTVGAEVATLGSSLGARDVDVRLALSPREERSLRQIAAGAAAPPIVPQSARTTSAQVVELTGTHGGVPTRVQATALTPPHEAWQIGGAVISSAAVAAAVVRLLARDALRDATGGAALTGVLPPERALPHHLLFPELERRGCQFSTTRSEVAVT